MVVNMSSDSYSQFQAPVVEDAQSSEDGSEIHSPVFAGDGYANADNFRYSHDHLDVQQSSGMLTPQYDYGNTLSAQQPQVVGISLELPNSSARIPFSPHYSIQSCNDLDFHIHPRLSVGGPMELRYSGERRQPSGSNHEIQPYTHPRENADFQSTDDHNIITAHAESMSSGTSCKTVRKEASNVVIACRQCRSRKIRCDSTRPICNNCVRRSNDCEYDERPRRRGPDKRPGTRQRSCKKRPVDGSAPPPKRRKVLAEKDEGQQAKPTESSPDSRTSDRYSPIFYQSDMHPTVHLPASDLRIGDPSSHLKESAPTRRQASFVYGQDLRRDGFSVARTLEREQRVWWDTILKSHSLNFIFDELSFIVRNTGNFLFFINLDDVMKQLYSEERRHIQPAFIYAVLGLAKLLRSSKLENDSAGLSHSLECVRQAHVAYKNSIDLHWLDITLVEAAFILALFEISAHSHHSPQRLRSSLINLDDLVQKLSLTSIDSHDRTSSRFSPGSVPVVPAGISSDQECFCTLPDSVATRGGHGHLVYLLPWDPNWSPREMANEEMRRLCWATLSLVSDYIAQCETFDEAYPTFYVTESANYHILFPGESLDRLSSMYRSPGSLTPKESAWALYCRSMLLWNFCHRFPNMKGDEELFDLASEVVAEAQSIEKALNIHKCDFNVELLYGCKAYLQRIRMLVTKLFRSFHGHPGRTSPPIFKRKQAQDWLFYGEQIFHRLTAVTHNLTGPDGNLLTRRPYRVGWFMNQLSDCLSLWNKDTTLDDALRLAKVISHILDVVNELWPCPVMEHKCTSLRRQLTEACVSTKTEAPIPKSLALPPLLRSSRS